MIEYFKKLSKYKERTALIDGENNVSYDEIIKSSKNLNEKICENSVSLLIADNNVNFIKGYIGFLNKKKNISILIDESFNKDFFGKVISLYRPNYIFLPFKFKKIFKEFDTIHKINDYIVLKTYFSKQDKLNFKNFLLLSTSGTTQNPKFVRLSSQNIETNIKNIIKYLKIRSNHKTITTMPLGYSYGLSILNSHLATGASIVLNKHTIFENCFWDTLKIKKINSFGGVPEFYEFLQKLNFEKRIVKTLKYITQAGGKLNQETLKYFGEICKKKKIKFYIMYGQTEAAPRMSYLDWKNFFKGFGSVGKALEGCNFLLKDKNGRTIKKEGKSGKIYFYGKNVFLGYANSFKDLKKGDENNGKLNTGDLGKYDKFKNLYILGRKDKFVKIFGKRCNLADLEDFLKEKKFFVKCNYNKPFLEINTSSFSNNEKIKKFSSEFLKLNSNFILIKKKKIKTFKEYV
jgi:long-chain acyl-CoA synthetase